MKKQSAVFALAFLTFAAGCARSGPAGAPALPQTAERSAQTGVRTGNFTEYALPSGVNPSDLTRGPYSTIYFTGGLANSPATVYYMSDSGGPLESFNGPLQMGDPQFLNLYSGITAEKGAVFLATEQFGSEAEALLTRVTPQGGFSQLADVGGPLGIGNLTVGSDGRVWFPACNADAVANSPNACWLAGYETDGSSPQSINLGNWFVGENVAYGPGGDLYLTAQYAGPMPVPPPSDSLVYVVSTNGTIVNKFPLHHGSFPQGIAVGSDGNLWIALPGLNRIGRMTPQGAVTMYALPTGSAGPDRITSGDDGALWFTETNGNNIGRITTSGQILEFAIPTANSQPTGIVICVKTFCPPHGGVWFTETAANKIGRFISPL